MPAIQLTDFVLLSSDFRVWPRGSGSEELEAEEFGYPAEDLSDISASVEKIEENEWVLYVRLDIDHEQFEWFELHVTVGARFEIPDEDLEPDRAKPTLLWLCYPYLRELVASISGRSPLPPYYMPALTMMPDVEALEARPEVREG